MTAGAATRLLLCSLYPKCSAKVHWRFGGALWEEADVDQHHAAVAAVRRVWVIECDVGQIHEKLVQVLHLAVRGGVFMLVSTCQSGWFEGASHCPPLCQSLEPPGFAFGLVGFEA